jgi:lipopolysaccharide export system protein LptC
MLAGLTFWLAYEPTSESTDEARTGTLRAADVIARETWVTTMTPDGLPDRTLRAVEVKYFDQGLGTELAMPHLTVYRDEGAPWEIRAERGWITRGGDTIRLEGSVVIERASPAGETPTRLTTDRLRVNPAREYAETDDEVAMTSADGHIEAVGMEAWLGTPARVKLLSKARGYYVPR